MSCLVSYTLYKENDDHTMKKQVESPRSQLPRLDRAQKKPMAMAMATVKEDPRPRRTEQKTNKRRRPDTTASSNPYTRRCPLPPPASTWIGRDHISTNYPPKVVARL